MQYHPNSRGFVNNRRGGTLDIHELQISQIYQPDDGTEGHERFGPSDFTKKDARGNKKNLDPKNKVASSISTPFSDNYFYFDSAFKDPTSVPELGVLTYRISTMNSNQPLGNIIEMEIGEFEIPNVDEFPSQLPIPETLFYDRVTVFIPELVAQPIYAANGVKFHFEFKAERDPDGLNYQLTPINHKFIFTQPFINLDTVTFIFRNPLGTLILQQDTFTATAVDNTSPGRFTIPLNTNLNFNRGDFYHIEPLAAPLGVAVPALGYLYAGNYQYVVTFVSTVGETPPGPASAVIVSAGFDQIQLNTIPLGATVIGGEPIIARGIYRTRVGGATYFLDGYIDDNVTTTYTSFKPDGALGAQVSTNNTTGGSLYSVFFTGFNSTSASLNAIVNRPNGHKVTKLISTTINTIQLTGTPTAVFPNFPGSNPTALMTVGYRRTAFEMRFRTISPIVTNGILPV
jgi:hypothetical protein